MFPTQTEQQIQQMWQVSEGLTLRQWLMGQVLQGSAGSEITAKALVLRANEIVNKALEMLDEKEK